MTELGSNLKNQIVYETKSILIENLLIQIFEFKCKSVNSHDADVVVIAGPTKEFNLRS